LGPIDLERNPNIQILSLHATAQHLVAASLKFLLSHLVLPNMERINFLLFMRDTEGTDVQVWKDIDAILDSERFIALRRVVLCFTDPLVEYGVDDPRLMKLYEQLHSLNSKGMLHVHSSKVNHIRS
jgi:hypothetical protein